MLSYNGPALDDHLIAVEDLAPSLLATARMLQDVQRVVAPSQEPAKLDIRATRPGSFEVGLLLTIPGVLETAMDFLLDKPAQATLSATGLLALGWNAVKFIAWMGKRAGLRPEELPEGSVRITDHSGSSIVVERNVLLVAQDRAFRESVEAATKPLDKPGIDQIKVSILSNSDADVVVSKSDRAALIVPDQDEEVYPPSNRRVVLSIQGLAFIEGNKWKVNDGDHTFYAAVDDLNFLARVETGEESFSANDTLLVDLRTKQTRTRKGAIKSEHSITKVVKHTPGPQQIPLPFEE